MGCCREKRLCQRNRERTQVGVLVLTTIIPSSTATSSETEKGEETLKGQRNQWGTITEASTPICSWSRNRTGVQTCHQLKGPELVYKETNFHDGNVERRFSEHQERRLGGYNVRDSSLMKGATEPVRDEHRGFYSNMLLVKKQDGGSDLSSTWGAWTHTQRNELSWWQRWKTFLRESGKETGQLISHTSIVLGES